MANDNASQVFQCDQCDLQFFSQNLLNCHIRLHSGETPFACVQCKKCFNDKKTLNRHMKSHITRQTYPCTQCKKQFACENLLNCHIRLHSGVKPFACVQCKKCFNDKKTLNRHMTSHIAKQTYPCSQCRKQFACENLLNCHIRLHSGENSFACVQCKKCFNDKKTLNRHMKSHIAKQTYPCSQCKKQFACENLLNCHIRLHSGETPFACVQCKKCFNEKKYLNRHMKSHIARQTYPCTQCKKQFACENLLNCHIRLHSGENSFACVQCKKCFNDKKTLNRHMESHITRQTYPCSQCKKQFACENLLNCHIRLHSGEKPFACVQCKKCFNDKKTLNHHMKSHIAKQTYPCSQCKKQFACENLLNCHIRLHSGEKPFACVQCKKCFNKKKYLNRHMKIHIAWQTYPCSQCKKQFVSNTNLDRHVEKFHVSEKQFACVHCKKCFNEEKSLIRHMKVHIAKESLPCHNRLPRVEACPIQEELNNYEFESVSALKKFYDSSAQYRPPSIDSLLGHSLTYDEMSISIKAYNNQMNPQMSMWGCAVCGERELNGAEHSLKIGQLSILCVPDDAFSKYSKYSVKIQQCFNIVLVHISGIVKAFYLNSNFLKCNSADHCHTDTQLHSWYENDDANVCNDCHRKLAGIKPSIPKFSIAAGYDFGHPLRAGFEPLTILERKLISRNIIFATIVKLVASCGKNTEQHGLQGHVISMPHEGAHIAAAVLPRMQSVTDMISVMFVGSAEQWHATSGKCGDSKRANFIISHKSIFQVRAHVVLAWLHALKAVGNPLYSDVDISECTEETSSRLEQIPNTLIDQAHVASNPKTIETELFTVSDVAHVRPQAIEGDENGIGLNGVLLKNIPLANAAPVCAVLESLHNTLVQKNINVDEIESNLLLSDHKADSVLSVHCHETPINEFVENDSLFLGAFPDLFFIGIKFPTAGSIPSLFTQHLLRQADNRFAQVDEIIFILFNQSQRHAAAKEVATHVYSDSDSVHKFTNIVEAPNFMKDLKSAIESPDKKESRALMNSIMPLVRVSGASVPFGPVQRSVAVSKLCAMIHYFGLPSWFVTVSPSDLDSIIILRLASPLKDNNDSMQCQFVVPHLNVCIETLANNPAAAAEVFIRLITALFECLVALPLHHNLKQSHSSVRERRQGIFGVPVAHFCAIEVQGRGSLHAHFIVMGGVAPDIMQAAVNNPEYLSIIQKKIDSMVKAEIPDNYFKQSVNVIDASKKEFRPALIQSPIPAVDADAFWDHVHHTAATVQCHKHSNTCRKGKSGRYSCRMAMPQHCWNKATGPVQLVSVKIHSGVDCNKILCSVPRALKCVEIKKIDNSKFNMPLPEPDSRSIIYELCRRSADDAVLSVNTLSPRDSRDDSDESIYERDDDPSGPNSNVVAYSPALTSALGCNTATYPLGKHITGQSNMSLFSQIYNKRCCSPHKHPIMLDGS